MKSKKLAIKQNKALLEMLILLRESIYSNEEGDFYICLDVNYLDEMDKMITESKGETNE